MVDHRRFLERERVRAAIVRAESGTSAPIAVVVASRVKGSVQEAALRELHRRGLHAPQRNAVLFYVVPSRREFAVVGDSGAHEAFGQETWNALAATVERGLRGSDPTDALVKGIEEAGAHLARHVPREG
jgi:uncharacterized membrane protein